MTREKYKHIESSSFKRLPAFLHLTSENRLEENTSLSRLIDDEIEEDALDSDEELAYQKVDMSLGPRNFTGIEDMIAFNEQRLKLVAKTLEEIRASSKKSEKRFQYNKPDGCNPDLSQMFNTVSVSNPTLLRVQTEWRKYLESCLRVANEVQTALSTGKPAA